VESFSPPGVDHHAYLRLVVGEHFAWVLDEEKASSGFHRPSETDETELNKVLSEVTAGVVVGTKARSPERLRQAELTDLFGAHTPAP
jgi:hypothetical protein